MGPATARTLQMLPPQARQAYLESMKFENTNVEPIIQPEETAPDQIASVSSVLKAPIMFEVPLKQTVEERTPQLTASNLSRNSIYSSSNPALANPFTYTGREDDGTGLMYYRGRYYDPKLEVFISQDIYGDAQRYANGNPLSYTDPMGWEAGYSYRAGPNGTEDPYTIPIDERSFSPQQQQCNRQCGLMALGLPVSGGVIVYGQPDLPTRGKFGNMTPGTSAISKAARRIPGKLPFQVPAPTAGNVGSRTASIGGAIGRWLPGIGYMGVPASLYAYSDCYERCMDDSNCGY
jgi:RHS repeat-associated protein